MYKITLKENNKEYEMPLSKSDWREIRNLIDDTVIDSCEFEMDASSPFYMWLPYRPDLEQLDDIMKNLQALQEQGRLDWVKAVLDVCKAGKIKLKTNLRLQSEIEVAIEGIFDRKYYFDEGLNKADYAKKEYECGGLDYLNISDEMLKSINWEKIFDEHLSKSCFPVNGGIVSIVEKDDE